MKGSLELLGISETLDSPRFANNIAGEIIYGCSFSNRNEFSDILEKAPNKTILEYLPIIYHLTQACDIDNWNNRVIYKASEAINNLVYDNAPPLVCIVAESISKKIDNDTSAEWIDIDIDDPKYAELIEDDRRMRENRAKWQKKLHDEFPLLPDNRNAVVISPDTAATFGVRSLEVIADKKGNWASLHNYESDNALGIDQLSSFLLRTAHDPDVKNVIDTLLDLDLSSISLPAQIQLLKYMTEAGDKRFDKLCSVMHNTDEDMKLKLAEGFLAVDFGEDFGDCLLAIAESKCYSKEQISEILDKIGSCRDSIKKITEFYKGFDGGKFVDEYTRAANERLTDVLTVFDKIGKNGSTEADLDWAGKIRYTYESAMEALAYEAKSLEIIGGTLGDLENGVDGAFAETVLPHDDSSARTSRTLYNLYSPNYGYVLLYTRPEGAHSFDPMLEYGKERSRYNTTTSNAGVEASISMIANPVDPFALPKPFRPDRRALKNLNFYDPETMDKVSAIRLDREGRVPGAPADDPNRDPTHQIGVVSVDLAAIGDRVDTPSGKISRLVSAGNKLRSQRMGESATFLNHNTNWFSQEEYGTADGFRRLVSYVDSLVLNWCKEHKPEDSVDSFHKRMRQVQKARGRKASKAVA